MGVTGDVFDGRYRLLELLGRGTFGEVWRAVDLHRGHEVALKMILNRDRSAAWHEARILTALKSEHILEVNNADVAVDVPYIDTALATCSLDQMAVPLGVEPGLAVDWMRRALRGLDLCHKRGLLHRDVKPQNVFLTSNGDSKLGDFGIAALMDAAGTADAHGDMRISAPELLTGGRASIASDVYSAACTLYALLAGRLPYGNGDPMAAIISGQCRPLRELAPHVSRALSDKVRKAMAVDPAERFPTPAAFDNALALPKRLRKFIPIAPHPGHVRCWNVTGHGADMRVCVLHGKASRYVTVETRREGSGNRVLEHCFDCPKGQLARKLRGIFDDLR
jgi:serine/threonine protein kinase